MVIEPFYQQATQVIHPSVSLQPVNWGHPLHTNSLNTVNTSPRPWAGVSDRRGEVRNIPSLEGDVWITECLFTISTNSTPSCQCNVLNKGDVDSCEGICLSRWSSSMARPDLSLSLLGETLTFVFVCVCVSVGGGVVCVLPLIGWLTHPYTHWEDIVLCEGMCKSCWGGLMVVPGLPYFYLKDIDFCACVCVGRGMIVVLDWLLLTGETLPRVWGICRPVTRPL